MIVVIISCISCTGLSMTYSTSPNLDELTWTWLILSFINASISLRFRISVDDIALPYLIYWCGPIITAYDRTTGSNLVVFSDKVLQAHRLASYQASVV